MARNSVMLRESFDEILTWLNPDREAAGVVYVQLRQSLARLFTWHRCFDVEELTDEVFDRVSQKVHDVRGAYEGDPKSYFYGVARNLIRENHKGLRNRVSITDGEVFRKYVIADEINKKEAQRLEEKAWRLKEQCIKELPTTEKRLILGYYQALEKRDVQQLAEDLGISESHLRVKIHRIRQNLRRNFLHKMEITR